jgi:hypothetical protein
MDQETKNVSQLSQKASGISLHELLQIWEPVESEPDFLCFESAIHNDTFRGTHHQNSGHGPPSLSSGMRGGDILSPTSSKRLS